ncbi:hypothetical protein CRUP_006294 [Coryphaenoides rupestris]|nr:hypothetical protein CRUP_006294 [Coryphaenoides rupestris]
MNKTLFACLLGAVVLALGDSLICNTCLLSEVEDCLGDSPTTVECAANQSCYIKTFNASTVELRTKGCIDNMRCNGSRSVVFAPTNTTIAVSNVCCDTADRCNHAPRLPATLAVVVGAVLVALGSRYIQ